LLFDKWFEGRETQAAESWRARSVVQTAPGHTRLLAILRFSHHYSACFSWGDLWEVCISVKVPVTQISLELIPSKPTRI